MMKVKDVQRHSIKNLEFNKIFVKKYNLYPILFWVTLFVIIIFKNY